jgi:hypothetical protein
VAVTRPSRAVRAEFAQISINVTPKTSHEDVASVMSGDMFMRMRHLR